MGESDLFVLTDRHINPELVKEQVVKYRDQIESYILSHADFLFSLKPLPVPRNTSGIIKAMLYAARCSGVGPMAAVAGAIAEYTGRALLEKCNEVVIENGGDIFLKTERKIKIGVFAGKSIFSNKIFINIKNSQTPLGICTSSGSVGHSLSFGNADAVVVTCKSASLADAVATAAANKIKTKKDFKKTINFVKSIKGVKGALIILGKDLGVWGDLEITN